MKYEPPNSRFYEFEGVLKLTTFPASKHINIENVALRGYKLKNASVYGLVLNVGNENKCLHSSIERELKSYVSGDSKYIKWLKKIMITACILGAIISLIIAWVYTTQRSSQYTFNKGVLNDKSNLVQFLENFFPLFLNFLTAIPINFVLISKITMLIYSKFIEWDVHAYTLKEIPTQVNDPKKIESLGYIEHLFTSKNHILTDNHLVFKMCSIGDMIYGTEESADKKAVFEKVDGFNFKDPRLHDDIIENNLNGVKCQELFKALAFCHSCKIRKGPPPKREKTYKYMNSEEEALLKAAQAFGFKFEARDKKRNSIR